MTIKKDLVSIFGQDSVFDDETILLQYSCDQSFVEARKPDVVVSAESVEQIQAVVRLANKSATPIIPFSSGLNLHGATIPREGGVVLDLSKMNKILMIDQDNWFAVIEPGVTYAQLQDELEQYTLRAMPPFGVPSGRSVLTSHAERDPALAAASFEYGNDLILDTEMILPYGDLFRTGLWASGGRPGSHLGPVRALLYRFWTATQGTMGILTKIAIQVEHLSKVREVFFLPFDSFEETVELLKLIQRKEIGLECFLLNSFNLAALQCEEWQIPRRFPTTRIDSIEFESIRKKASPWTLIICLSGGPRIPEGKIAYEEEALHEACSQLDLRPFRMDGIEEIFLREMIRPWGILKKFCYRGSVHDLSFKCPLKKVTALQDIIFQCAKKYDYPLRDIGAYVLPLERGRAMHCEFDLHCDGNNAEEKQQVKQLWLDASQRLIENGAFFDRPYGAWADMMYSRTGTYTQKLKELKRELDPKNILNPGHLCF